MVITIIGMMLLWVPPNLDSFGERSRLSSTASSVASTFTAARELAIIDGHETRIQFDLPGETKDRTKTGRWRYMVTTIKKETPDALKSGNASDQRREEPPEEEWAYTEWHDLQHGVLLWGFSQEAGTWIRSNPRGEPLEVAFLADGSVRPACAIRVQSMDIQDVAERTMTVRVNALTSASEVIEGEADLPHGRDSNDFR